MNDLSVKGLDLIQCYLDKNLNLLNDILFEIPENDPDRRAVEVIYKRFSNNWCTLSILVHRLKKAAKYGSAE